MATKYSTLSLDEELPRERSRKGFYVLVGLAVVALAGVATLTATGHGKMEMSVDSSSEFNYAAGSVPRCNVGTDERSYLAELPKYDPEFTPKHLKDNGFVNACYYAFRCCTTGSGACGAGSDQDFGGDCQTCLKTHTPRKVHPVCKLYFEKKVKKAGGGGVVECADKNGILTAATLKRDPRCKRFVGQPPFTLAMLRAGQKPKFNKNNKLSAALEAEFVNLKTCMPQGGDNDGFKNSFTKQCFEMVSWCDLTCPRDGDNSIQHAYCKNCFSTSMSAIRTSNQRSAASAKKRI